jgi:hypothetical protein
MRIFNEEELLNEGYRGNVIQEIECPENLQRKAEVYKDNTKPYVLNMLNNESADKKAVAEAVNRSANVSFTREVVEKKAMVYKDGVTREVLDGEEDSQQQVDALSNILNVNSKMKKTNKYAELFKNALVTVLPYESPSEPGKYRLMLNCMQPYLYDVIEDAVNPEIGRVFIFSYYTPAKQASAALPDQAGNREAPNASNVRLLKGDGVDQTIADTPDDKGADKKEYIWWSNKYHFTTDEKGQLIAGRQEDDLANPIGCLPMYNFSCDQDGQFWAQGGDDIVDAGILLNLLLTDLFYIAKYQGMGIAYLFGKGVPKNVKVGPSALITMEVEEGDPSPQIGFATSSPPIQAHLTMIKDYLMFILLTNKLSPDMADATMSTSGVHEMIKQSQNTADIEDQRELYRDGEPVIYSIISKWYNLYFDRGLLDEEFTDVGKLDEGVKVKPKFKDAQPFLTELEKLDVIAKRAELKLDTKLDAIKRDNPDLDEDEAQEKLKQIMEESLKESAERLKQFGGNDAEQTNIQAEVEGHNTEGED